MIDYSNPSHAAGFFIYVFSSKKEAHMHGLVEKGLGRRLTV
jgi:hypothetical protein